MRSPLARDPAVGSAGQGSGGNRRRCTRRSPEVLSSSRSPRSGCGGGAAGPDQMGRGQVSTREKETRSVLESCLGSLLSPLMKDLAAGKNFIQGAQ